MDIQKLLQGFSCECGKIHQCDIKYVYVEKGASSRLTSLCQDFHSILLVADENTFAAAGPQTAAALSEKHVKQLIFPASPLLIPNEAAIAEVERNLTGIDLIIGIGSGVIQDLCKYVSHFRHIPYFIVATAPSMDGYASTGAAMITDGMKVTYSVGLPTAIIADTDVLKNAPLEMIKAGYGDIIGKYSALNDWKLSHVVNGEYFCQRIYDLTYDMLQQTIQLADGLLKRDAQSVQVLMEALIVVGIAMSFAGSSRPASGSEHHLSHFFEITGIVHGQDYFPHGIDVVYSTVVTAQLRQELLSRPFSSMLYRLSPEEYEAKMKTIYGSVAEGCIALQEKVGNYAANRLPIYHEKEQEIRSILAEMPTPQEVLQLIGAVELNILEFYDLYSPEKLHDAVLYAKDLKDRYTVLWMYYDLLTGDSQWK